MTDILDAAQKQINDAAKAQVNSPGSQTDAPRTDPAFKSATPPIGSAVGRTEPPPPAPKPPAPPSAPPTKTGSSLDFTSKTEPIQSPPLPVPPPELPLETGGWSPQKARMNKESIIDAPIANLPQYDNTPASPAPGMPPIPPPVNPVKPGPIRPPVHTGPLTGQTGMPTSNTLKQPDLVVPSQSPGVVPPPKKKSKKKLLVAIILFLALSIPIGVYFVSTSPQLAEIRSQAVGDVRWLCTPSACSPGCNQPCTANLAGTNITWDGNNYIVPGNGYAIKNKCIGEDIIVTGRACSCPIANITDPTGSGDTCNLPNVERYFVRGPATIGWDANFCGTQQVDITVGLGNSSFFHSIADTRPQTCEAPTPTSTPQPPQCDIEDTIHIYDRTGTDITAALKNRTRPWRTNEPLTVGAKKEDPTADHARFRLQPFGDWIRSTEAIGTEPNIEYRAPIVIPPTFSGTQVTLEVELCDAQDNCF